MKVEHCDALEPEAARRVSPVVLRCQYEARPRTEFLTCNFSLTG